MTGSFVALLTINMKVSQLLGTLKTSQEPIDVNVRFRIFADLMNCTIRSNPKLKSVNHI